MTGDLQDRIGQRWGLARTLGPWTPAIAAVVVALVLAFVPLLA